MLKKQQKVSEINDDIEQIPSTLNSVNYDKLIHEYGNS